MQYLFANYAEVTDIYRGKETKKQQKCVAKLVNPVTPFVHAVSKSCGGRRSLSLVVRDIAPY